MSQFTYRPQAPCKRNCPGRNATCHATCGEYAEYQKILDAYRAQRTREWNAKIITDAILEHGHEIATHKHPIRHGKPTNGGGRDK